MKTPFTDRIGIAAPIASAPIAMSPELVAAVGNAGGLGVLPGTWLSADVLHHAVRYTRMLTSAPVCVNLVLNTPRDDQLEVALAAGVEAVSFTWGDPERYLERVHSAGAVALHTVSSAEEARRAVSVGVDVVVAQGWEAGGHVRGAMATLPLVPAVREAVGETPVLAAGGVADGKGLAAVLALGADGAWIGTRFLASREAPVSGHYQRRVIEASGTDSVHTRLFDVGWPDAPHRVLRNTTLDAWEASGRPASGARPGESENIATMPDGSEVVRYSIAAPYEGFEGDLEALAMYAGQAVGAVRQVDSVATIVQQIVDEAESVIARLADRNRADRLGGREAHSHAPTRRVSVLDLSEPRGDVARTQA